jgi:hypothetical protein
MFRYKTIIGRCLHARTLPNQKTEARIGSPALACRSPFVSNRPRTKGIGAPLQFFMHQRPPTRIGDPSRAR